MTFKDFLEKINDIASYNYKKKKTGGYNNIPHNSISITWSLGGQSGGSCWSSGDTHYTIPGETEPEFNQLDEILDIVCPTITFLKYKQLNRECVKVVEHTSSDYYGNYTNYASKYITLDDLYSYLKKEKLI